MTQRSDAGEARTPALQSQAKHSTIEPLRSHCWLLLSSIFRVVRFEYEKRVLSKKSEFRVRKVSFE